MTSTVNPMRGSARWVSVFAAFVMLSSVWAIAPSAAADTIVVGVVHSQSSANYAAGVPPHPFSQGYDIAGREAAATRWVDESRYTLKVLTDADLENRAVLDTVDVVLLPYTVAMNSNASMTVRQWIHDGGGIIPVLASPRFFINSSGQWDLWILEMNYEAWEWGPLSEAYQMQFVNDPNVSQWDAVLQPGHPITNQALATLGVSSARFVRPVGTGVEFGYPYNNNVESILSYDNLVGDEAKYNGWSAAQAVRYGSGRIVYFDIPVIDNLPYYNRVVSELSGGGGVTNAHLVDAVLDSAIDWVAQPSDYVPINPQGRTRGEVDIWGDAIYVRQYVTADGEWPVLGSAYARVYRPDGSLWMEQVKPEVGVQPGGQRMYSWSFRNYAPLLDGQYRVELEYTFTYPDYDRTDVAEVYVRRSQGTNIPTVPANPAFTVDFSHFSPLIHPVGGYLSIDAASGTPWTATVSRRDGSPSWATSGTGSSAPKWDGAAVAGPYLAKVDFGALGSIEEWVQVGSYEWPFVDDEGSWALGEIREMWDRGITQGCDWNLFCPDARLTRAELATLLARSMNDTGSYPSYRGYYTDVPRDEWYTGPIEYLVERGVLSGGGTFGVGYPATRALVVDMLMTVLGSPLDATYHGYFSDVPENAWFRMKVETAYQMGIAKGRPDGTFGPYDTLTRQEAAAFLMRGL